MSCWFKSRPLKHFWRFSTRHTTHLEKPRADGMHLSMDWQAQLHKIKVGPGFSGSHKWQGPVAAFRSRHFIEVHYMQSVYCHGGHQVTKRSFRMFKQLFSASLNNLECMWCNATWHGWNMHTSRRRLVMKKPFPFCEAVSAQFEKMPELDDGHWVTKAFDSSNFLPINLFSQGRGNTRVRQTR